jgi:aldehyde:ferredoxin oxidoreductase
MLSNKAGILPVRNFTGGSHGEAHKVSGERIMEKYNGKFDTCKPCSILCGHKATFNGTENPVPEYETTGLLGPNLEIFDPVAISEFNEICGRMGMDTISSGGTIAWAMEATEKGLFKSDLKFGSAPGVSKALLDIAHARGIGKELGMGSRWLSKKYGGEDFAMHVKGLELAAYDPRGAFGQGLSYAVANRGACHLSSAFFALEAYLHMYMPYTTWGKASYTEFAENCFDAVNSLHICQFTAFPVFLQRLSLKCFPRCAQYRALDHGPACGLVHGPERLVAVLVVDYGQAHEYVADAQGRQAHSRPRALHEHPRGNFAQGRYASGQAPQRGAGKRPEAPHGAA